jgi:putative spermidine/putrescine transport system substrate-binding protein
MTTGRFGASRRGFLGGMGATAAAMAWSTGPMVMASAKARAAERISFVSFGGSYGDFVKEEWIKPFTAQTGIEVEYVTGPDLAKVKAQVTSKSVEWDVFDGAGSTIFAGSKENLWEPLDTGIIDTSRFVIPAGTDKAPSFIFTGGIAYNPTKITAPARDFKQLWDVQKFPGRRGLRTRVSETVEAALLADGVEPARIYPLDLDRGFKALDRIKPAVTKWFEQTTQGITLIQTGEVDYTYTYANRVKAAKESGIPIDFSFDQTISAINYYTVPRGCPRKQAAMKFIEFVTRPDRQALMSNKLGLVPVTNGAEEQITPENRKWLPDLKNPKNILVSDAYWRDHFVAADRRFKEWILT